MRGNGENGENGERGFRPAPLPTAYYSLPSLPLGGRISQVGSGAATTTTRVLPALDVDVMLGRRNGNMGGGGGGGRMVLDADGVLVESEEPGSPDKVGNEVMMWPGR